MDWLKVAAFSGFAAVAIGAFGAHGLKERLAATGYQAQFETGVLYHMFHVAALLAVALLATWGARGRALDVAGWCFLAGTMLFSGSLYALGLSGLRWLGAITPLGGTLFLAGWVALALVVRSRVP